jgi:hypothetical protein
MVLIDKDDFRSSTNAPAFSRARGWPDCRRNPLPGAMAVHFLPLLTGPLGQSSN